MIFTPEKIRKMQDEAVEHMLHAIVVTPETAQSWLRIKLPQEKCRTLAWNGGDTENETPPKIEKGITLAKLEARRQKDKAKIQRDFEEAKRARIAGYAANVAMGTDIAYDEYIDPTELKLNERKRDSALESLAKAMLKTD